MQTIFSLPEIKAVAVAVWNEVKNSRVLAFYAPMGAGKTTFIHALCQVLKVKDVVGSPTFAIINEYESAEAGTIYHMDWYRLKDEAEAIQAGVEDCLQSGKMCFIEWPEKMEQLLPGNTLHISIEMIDSSTRKISILNKQIL